MSKQNTTEIAQTIIHRKRLCNLEEAQSLLSSSYAPVILNSITQKPFELTVSCIGLQDIQIYRTSSISGVRFESVGHFDGFTFSSVRQGSAVAKSGVKEYLLSTGANLLADALTIEQMGISEGAAYRGFALSAGGLANSLAEKLGIAAVKRIAFEHSNFDPAVQTICDGITNLIFDGLVHETPLRGNVFALKSLQDALVNTVLYGTQHNYSNELRAGEIQLPRVVRTAMEYIAEFAHEGLTTTEVAKHLGIGLRSLQISFQNHLGITPNQYLRSVRLKNARDELLSGDFPTVGEVARRWGFLSPGPFARIYRQEFGERPAVTKRR